MQVKELSNNKQSSFVRMCHCCRIPKGYGFIKFQNGEDAKMAKEHLNHRVINGEEISIEYSSDSNRKKPRQMALINSGTRYFQ